jgi:hypothetical protein
MLLQTFAHGYFVKWLSFAARDILLRENDITGNTSKEQCSTTQMEQQGIIILLMQFYCGQACIVIHTHGIAFVDCYCFHLQT